MKRNDELLENTIIIAIGVFTTKILSFILVPFYTLWLSPEEYGNFDLLVTYISFFIPFATFQLEQAIFRFCMENKSKSKEYYNNAILIVLFNILICNIIIYVLLRKYSYMIPFMLYFDSYALYNCGSEYLRGTNKLKLYSITNILTAIIIVILNIIFVYKLKLQNTGMLLSYGLAYMIGILYICFKEKLISKNLFKDYDKKVQIKMLKYSIPLIPNSISWWITHITDRTMIKLVLGSFYNGIYAVSCKIPTLVNLLFNVFNLSWQQTAIKTLKDKDKNEYYEQLYKKLVKFLYTSAFCIIAVTPILFKFFIAKDYYIGIYQVPIILNAIIFLSMAQFLGGIFLADMDTKSVGITTINAAIINFIINVLFINVIGLTAASISTFLSYLVLFIFRHRKLSKKLNGKKIVNKIVTYNIGYILITILIYLINNIYIDIVFTFLFCAFFVYSNYDLVKMLLLKILKKDNI